MVSPLGTRLRIFSSLPQTTNRPLKVSLNTSAVMPGCSDIQHKQQCDGKPAEIHDAPADLLLERGDVVDDAEGQAVHGAYVVLRDGRVHQRLPHDGRQVQRQQQLGANRCEGRKQPGKV